MESTQFEEWFDSIFLEHAKKISGNKVLIFDGHYSHVTVNVVEKARMNNIHIVKLPPYSTNYLQPMDVGVFKPLKTEWSNLVKIENV